MIKLKPRTRIILLSVISILIVITIVLGITYSFMQANIDSSSVTEVSLSSCAKITLSDTGASINLNKTNPISKNRALQTTPYTFTVTSSCESYVGFNLYLATLNTNTLVDSSVHYIITRNGSKDILAEGILSEATNALSEFTSDDQNQLNIGINGTFGTIYRLYNDDIPLQGEVSYDLYLYVDSEVTDASTMGKTFNAGIAVKSYDREADPTTLADYIINEVYTGTDGDNGLYYHDADLANGAGDSSYRFSGANPNNYVCFGVTGADCQNEENQYRIIGVFNNQVKLIKATYAPSSLLGTNGAYQSSYYYYWSNSTNNNTWSQSNLNTVNLNTNYLNNIGSTWSSKIANHTWQVGGFDSATHQAPFKTAYDAEVGTSTTTYDAKIGLMYVTDYLYASQSEEWTTTVVDYAYVEGSDPNNNWMYMGIPEWTISRSSEDSIYVFDVSNAGTVSGNGVGYDCAVRPVFYLESSVELRGGTGTASDPYRIA